MKSSESLFTIHSRWFRGDYPKQMKESFEDRLSYFGLLALAGVAVLIPVTVFFTIFVFEDDRYSSVIAWGVGIFVLVVLHLQHFRSFLKDQYPYVKDTVDEVRVHQNHEEGDFEEEEDDFEDDDFEENEGFKSW